MSPLNAPIRGPQSLKAKEKAKTMDSHPLVTPAIFKPGSRNTQKHGCLIKDFRHDGGGMSPPESFYHPLFVTPAIFKPGSTVFKIKRKGKSMDSR